MPIDYTRYRQQIAELQAQAAALIQRYEYTDSHGDVHVVSQDSKGRWINNQVIGHTGLSTAGKSTGGGKKAGSAKSPEMKRLKDEEKGLKARISEAKKTHVPADKQINLDLSQLQTLADPYDGSLAWHHFGGSKIAVFRGLAKEPLGPLSAMARKEHVALPDGADRLTQARLITEALAQRFEGATTPEARQQIRNDLLKAEADMREAAPPKAGRVQSTADQRQRDAFLADHAAHMEKHAAYLAAHPEVAKHLQAADKAARGKTAEGKARAPRDEGVQPNYEPQLQKLNDPFDPLEAWQKLGGRQGLLAFLPYEPTGVLETMLRHPNMPPGPKPKSNAKATIARNIINRLTAYHEHHHHK